MPLKKGYGSRTVTKALVSKARPQKKATNVKK